MAIFFFSSKDINLQRYRIPEPSVLRSFYCGRIIFPRVQYRTWHETCDSVIATADQAILAKILVCRYYIIFVVTLYIIMLWSSRLFLWSYLYYIVPFGPIHVIPKECAPTDQISLLYYFIFLKKKKILFSIANSLSLTELYLQYQQINLLDIIIYSCVTNYLLKTFVIIMNSKYT